MRVKGQSAMEFLFTYSLVLTIIAVAFAILFFLVSGPASTAIPPQCAFNGGFTCTYSVFTVNTVSGSGAQLLVIATDLQPGVVNVSSFSASIGGLHSTFGYCTPNIATVGQSIYCIANLAVTPSVGSTYSATFNVIGNYCPGYATQLYNYTCPITSNYIYGGSLQSQATVTPVTGTSVPYYAPVTLTNNGPTLINRFDVQASLPVSAYTAYESKDLGNIRFYDGARELYSWCQSGCSSSSTNAIIWIAMDRPVPSNTVVTLQMYFLPTSVEYDGVFAGEAPNMTSSYAEYDNGKNVFQFYDDFTGNSLSPIWAQMPTSANAALAVNDGMEIKVSGNNGGYVGVYASVGVVSSNEVMESYLKALGSGESLQEMLGYGTTTSNTNFANGYGLAVGTPSSTLTVRQIAAGSPTDEASVTDTLVSGSFYTTQFTWVNGMETSSDLSTGKSVPYSGTTYTLNQISQTGIAISSSNPDQGDYILYWFRLRPGGAQPSLAYGSATQVP